MVIDYEKQKLDAAVERWLEPFFFCFCLVP